MFYIVVSLYTYTYTGLEVDVPKEGKRTVRAQLLCVVVDLPAKAAILNCMQYNGEYGCSSCKHPGCSVSQLYYLCMYRLHHKVEVSSRFTHRGPQARGCVNREETEPSDVTDLYQGLCGPDNASTA